MRHVISGVWVPCFMSCSLGIKSIHFNLVLIGFFLRTPPFISSPNDTPTVILDRIGQGNLDLTSGNWANISNEAKVCLNCLITLNLFMIFLIFFPEFSPWNAPHRSKATIQCHNRIATSMDPTSRSNLSKTITAIKSIIKNS